MNARADDDALSWSGDDDPTLDVGSEGAPTLPPGFTAVGRGSEARSDTPATEHPDTSASTPSAVAEDPPAPGAGNAALITVGVLGGVYLLYAIGWLVGGLRLQGRAQYLIADAMFQGSLWLAVLAPALWFGSVLLMTRSIRSWVRFAWLAAGVVLLLPWPFVMIGAVGQ
ncbi:DNA polymerase III subunit gamma/tau [Microbacterium chocolatum]|uniref:DNA polymerase III subunit gamma/tau n=1 Tax=Microbacterium aurantiacum TaxID=162393 RepID=UPI00338E1D58